MAEKFRGSTAASPEPAASGRRRRAALSLMAAVGISAAAALSAVDAASADALSEAAGSYVVQPSSSIRFHVGQVGGGGIDGRFTAFSGTFKIVGNDVSRSTVAFTLRPASVSTGQARMDEFLRSDAVFDVDAHPAIAFRSTSVKRTGENGAVLDGTLTARGKSRPARFDVTVTSRSGRDIAFHVVGDILRSPYGMDVGTPIYSNVVHFDMQVAGRR